MGSLTDGVRWPIQMVQDTKEVGAMVSFMVMANIIIQMVPSTKVHGKMGRGMALERTGIAMDTYTKESGHKIRNTGRAS